MAAATAPAAYALHHHRGWGKFIDSSGIAGVCAGWALGGLKTPQSWPVG